VQIGGHNDRKRHRLQHMPRRSLRHLGDQAVRPPWRPEGPSGAPLITLWRRPIRVTSLFLVYFGPRRVDLSRTFR
jgi:hypothetical protein